MANFENKNKNRYKYKAYSGFFVPKIKLKKILKKVLKKINY